MTENAQLQSYAAGSVTVTASHSEQLTQFLRFHLLPDMTALISVEQLTEVLKVSLSQITPIPHLPDWVMGVYNWRGTILWMVDLGSLIGLPPWHQQENPPAIISVIVIETCRDVDLATQPEYLPLGLLVNQVEDIEWLDMSQLQSPPTSAITDRLAPFLSGYWLSTEGTMLTLLDGEAILERMPT